MAFDRSNLGFIFGILGNIISVCVGLSPIPTFYHICKKKTAEGYQSIPYVVSLFSATLWIYYALLKNDGALLIITINVFACVVQSIYTLIFIVYAPKKDKISTITLVVLLNVFGFGGIYLLTLFLAKGEKRLEIIGYICMAFSICVYASPLAILNKVRRTKSVEYMPFYLTITLTLGAIMWFFYGFLFKDMNIAIPNVIGFVLGLVQMLFYVKYKNYNNKRIEDAKLDYLTKDTKIDVPKLGTFVMIPGINNTVVPKSSIDDINGNNRHDNVISIQVENMNKELESVRTVQI